MYCRKCGARINEKAQFCDHCGEKVVVVKQRNDSQKYADRKMEEKKSKKESPKKRNRKEEELKNPYVIPALGSGILAFILAVFPWPVSWKIGTSIWMRIIIVVLALLSDYHCTKARQMNNLYRIKYNYEVQPGVVKVATAIATFVTIVSMFALVTM